MPVYAFLATAEFALRSVSDVGALVPLHRRLGVRPRHTSTSSSCFALFTVAARVALWVDRPERAAAVDRGAPRSRRRAARRGAVLVVPGLAGHAAQTSPRGAVAVPRLGCISRRARCGSAGWSACSSSGASLPAARASPGLASVVPRFSNVAFVSVIVLIASGIGAAIVHLPTVASLWQTSYGQAILVKIGLLLAAMLLAAVNLLRTKTRLGGREPESLRARRGSCAAAHRAAKRARRGCDRRRGRAVVAAATVEGAGRGRRRERARRPGTGRLGREEGRLRVRFRVAPNKAAVPNAFSVEITRNGKPVRDAGVVAHVCDVGHGDAQPGVPSQRDEARGSTATRSRRS